jgi:hypothetical protein
LLLMRMPCLEPWARAAEAACPEVAYARYGDARGTRAKGRRARQRERCVRLAVWFCVDASRLCADGCRLDGGRCEVGGGRLVAAQVV